MKIRVRRRKLIAALLTVAMLSANLGITPVFAYEFNYKREEVSFDVRKGDYLIAVNPRPWEDLGITSEDGMRYFENCEEVLGTTEKTETIGSLYASDEDSSSDACTEGVHSRSGTLELERRQEELLYAHPEVKMRSSASLFADKNRRALKSET